MNIFSKWFSKKQTSVTTDSNTLAGQYKADCKVDIIEPHKQDSMFPTYVIVKLLPNGLGLSFDSKSASKLDGFTKAAIIGEYHWLNSEDSINPFIMFYGDIDNNTSLKMLITI